MMNLATPFAAYGVDIPLPARERQMRGANDWDVEAARDRNQRALGQRAAGSDVDDIGPEPAQPGGPARSDYGRKGTANLFMVFEPLAGWR